MLYYVCPSCKTWLGDKSLQWEKRMPEIINKKMTSDEQEKAQKKLLDELEVNNFCCRMRMITYIRVIEMVK